MILTPEPYIKFDHGTTRQPEEAKRLFMHVERIKSESAERNRHAALWLHCLGHPTTGASSTGEKDKDRDQDGRDEGDDDDDDDEDDHASAGGRGKKRRADNSERKGKRGGAGRGGNDKAGSSTRTRHLARRLRSTVPTPPPDALRLVSAWLANTYKPWSPSSTASRGSGSSDDVVDARALSAAFV